jgi:myosin heavy subunit
LEWEPVSFTNNQSSIDCIAKHPTGILQQLEEYGSLNRKGDNPDAALLAQFHQTSDKIGNCSFVKSRFKDQYFTIRHYAGDVIYGFYLRLLIDYFSYILIRFVNLSIDVNGFVAKNNFALTEDLTELLVGTDDTFLSNLFQGSPQPSGDAEPVVDSESKRGGGGKKRVGAISLSSQFRQQVDALMLQLKCTKSRYIKVISSE